MSCNGTKRTFSLLTKAALAATVSAAITLPATGAFAAGTTAAHSTTQTRVTAYQAAQLRLKHIRLRALGWAEQQKGKWYCWGGTGPSCYDCSGLVWSAYQHAGVWLPRDTYSMLASPKLRWIPASQARPGDLAFYGTGHVELVARGGTFGALDFGSLVGLHQQNDWFYPTMYYALR